MKKVLLAAGLVLGLGAAVNANSLTCINTTNCTYYGSTQGGFITIPPGPTSYASPANVTNPSAPPSGTFSGLKVDISPSFATQLFVGTGGPTSAVSSTVGVFPACNSGNAYTVTWNVGGTGNIVVLFL